MRVWGGGGGGWGWGGGAVTPCPLPRSAPHPPPTHCTHPPTAPTHALAVYHVTEAGWTKVRGQDVGELHYSYYPHPEQHPTNSVDPLAI